MCHKWLVKLFCTKGVITKLWHHPCQTYGDSSYLNEHMYIRLHVSRADKDEVAQKLSNYHAICKIIVLSTEWSKNSCLACHNHWGCVWEWMYLNYTDGLILHGEWSDANLKQLAEAETVFVGTFHTYPEFSIGCLPFVPSRMAHSFHLHSSSYLTMLVVHTKDLYLPKGQV